MVTWLQIFIQTVCVGIQPLADHLDIRNITLSFNVVNLMLIYTFVICDGRLAGVFYDVNRQCFQCKLMYTGIVQAIAIFTDNDEMNRISP